VTEIYGGWKSGDNNGANERLSVREGDNVVCERENAWERRLVRVMLCLSCVLELKLIRCRICVAKTVSIYHSWYLKEDNSCATYFGLPMFFSITYGRWLYTRFCIYSKRNSNMVTWPNKKCLVTHINKYFLNNKRKLIKKKLLNILRTIFLCVCVFPNTIDLVLWPWKNT